MLETERVCDPLAASVGQDDLIAGIVICCMRYVPHLECMIAPCALLVRFHVRKNLCA
jgi:hypothetical protein